jgi:hypothetical protein
MLVTEGVEWYLPPQTPNSFYANNNMIQSISIPQQVREALDKSPNASPRNTIIVSQLNETLYAARWNLQPHKMELDQLWEVNCEIQSVK